MMPLPAFDIYVPKQMTTVKTEMVFDEKMLKSKSIDVDPNTLHIFNGEQYRKNENTGLIVMTARLSRLAEAWLNETAFMSSPNETMDHAKFKEIVSYGNEIIPAILLEIDKRPSTLVWALNVITGRTISDKPITVTEACKKWVQWGIKVGLIK